MIAEPEVGTAIRSPLLREPCSFLSRDDFEITGVPLSAIRKFSRRTELIGLISNDFDNPAFMEIFDLFTRRLQQRGRRPLLVNLTDGAPPGGVAKKTM